MTRSIRLVVAASSPVLSVDDETKMNPEKHESSLLTVVSDVGSTPTASTILNFFTLKKLQVSGKNQGDFCTAFCTVALLVLTHFAD